LPSVDDGDGEGDETIMPSGEELEKMDKPAPVKRSGNVQTGSRCIVAGFISTYGENKSGGDLGYAYFSDGLSAMRRDWELFVGGSIDWQNDDEGGLECLM
jgi:hypothetical protein